MLCAVLVELTPLSGSLPLHFSSDDTTTHWEVLRDADRVFVTISPLFMSLLSATPFPKNYDGKETPNRLEAWKKLADRIPHYLSQVAMLMMKMMMNE